ncbi:MAG: hypothetical protein WCY60_06130 [Trueperaceae bacterium]
MRADRLEQVFVKRAGAGYELLLVLESDAGRRERVTLSVPKSVAATDTAAVAYLVRWLRSSGAGLAAKVRVRRERSGELSDAPQLRQQLLDADLSSGAGTAVGGRE